MNLLRNKNKLLILSLVLSLVLIAGCSSDDSSGSNVEQLILEEATVQKGTTVATDLSQITLTFNKEIDSADVGLLEDSTKIDTIDKTINGEKLVVDGFSLTEDKYYELTYDATDVDGKNKTGSINFNTVDLLLPDVSGIEQNQTIMQAFYWEMNTGEYAEEYPEEANLWNLLENRADKLSEVGITSLWLPPANKAWGGVGVSANQDVGYGTHDLWDLGEFDKQGSTRTKYGTKSELVDAVDAIHNAGMKAYYDIIFNHRMGAYNSESVTLSPDSPNNPGETVTAYTDFNLDGRDKYYTKDKWGDLWHDFSWDHTCFDAVDYVDEYPDAKKARYLFAGKDWGLVPEDSWTNTPDYLMGQDVDYYNYPNGYDGEPEPNTKVINEMKAWGQWITKEIGFDGFRIDAVKHVDSNFIYQWINYTQENTAKDLFFVGEAWIESRSSLKSYLELVDNRANNFNETEKSDLEVFDFPLRAEFKALRDGNGSYDMSNLANQGLINDAAVGSRAVGFVDNHDTSGSNASNYGHYRIDKYNYQAYAYILTRKDIVPTVFWKDYYQHDMKAGLDRLIKARKYFAYGPEHEGPSDSDVYSYVREGLDSVAGTGLVLMLSDGTSGEIATRTVNSGQANTTYIDLTGNIAGEVTTDSNGDGQFKVEKSEANGWSVWVPLN